MISKDILEQYNAKIVDYEKGEIIFERNNSPKYYYQIISGGVKMSYHNDKGNEFIQGIFGKDRSFGEPPLLADLTYPANASTISKAQLFCIAKHDFFKLLNEYQEVHLNLTKMLSKRLYFKAVMANGITSNSAEEAILSLFKYLKTEVYGLTNPFSCRIDLTRKNIAGLTGLTIETTIRKIKDMEKNNILKIEKGVVYY